MKWSAGALILAAASALAASSPRIFTELPPGRYSIAVKGMLCVVCARAIKAEWAKSPELEKVEVRFDEASATVMVRLDSSLPVAVLTRGLRRAEKTANLGARFELGDIHYLRSTGP